VYSLTGRREEEAVAKAQIALFYLVFPADKPRLPHEVIVLKLLSPTHITMAWRSTGLTNIELIANLNRHGILKSDATKNVRSIHSYQSRALSTPQTGHASR